MFVYRICIHTRARVCTKEGEESTPRIIVSTLLSIAIFRFAQWRRSILTMISGLEAGATGLYGKQNEINKTAAGAMPPPLRNVCGVLGCVM